MAEPHVAAALRDELAGGVEITARKLQVLRAARSGASTRRCLFDPSVVPETIDPKVWRPKPDWARHGEMTRICLDILRRGFLAGQQPGHPAGDEGECRMKVSQVARPSLYPTCAGWVRP